MLVVSVSPLVSTARLSVSLHPLIVAVSVSMQYMPAPLNAMLAAKLESFTIELASFQYKPPPTVAKLSVKLQSVMLANSEPM